MSIERAEGLSAELRVVRGLSMRWFRELSLSPLGAVVLLGVKPIVWYVLFGSLFERVTMLPGFPAEDYKAFILPGVAALMAIEYVVLGGQCIVDDISTGFIGKMWAAPVSRASVVVARVIVMSTMSVIQVSFLFVLAYADGVTLATGAAGAVALAALIALLTVATTALSLFVAYAIKYEFAFSIVTSFLVLPVLFVSNAFVPTSFMPGWLETAAELNPVSVVISGMRTLVLDGWVRADLVPAFGLSIVLAVGLSALAALTFMRTLENEPGLLTRIPGL